MLRLYVKTLGCKVNAIESEHILDELGDFRIEQVTDETYAEVALVNTCSVTAEADAKTRKAIRKLAKNPLITDVVVTGCSAALHPELSDIDEKIRIVVDKTQVLRSLTEFHNLDKQGIRSQRKSMRARGFVKIQDGCENFCTYCIVPFARGENFSLPYREIKTQILAELQTGVHEVVLSGINIGNYCDMSEGITNLSELIRRLLAELDIYRLRISSIEPPDVTDEFLEYFASENRICKHLHLPLQSGSDNILKKMGRYYCAQDFLALVRRVYELVPDCAITTDVIVGFPTESENDFEQTLKLCNEAAFSQLHVFKYSKRAGTPAAEYTGQIESEIATDRSQRLRELSVQLHEQYKNKFKGRELEIVVESFTEGRVRGLSEYYLRYEASPQALLCKEEFHWANKEGFLNEECLQVGSIARILG